MKHISSNTAKIDFYNRMKKLCSPLSGGRNSSPQNSGVIMAHIHLSRPIFRSNGNCIKNGSYADSEQVRGEENIKTLLSNITKEDAKDVHEKLREILIEAGNEEWGDIIVDDISNLFGFPTTIDVEPEID